MNEDQSDQEPDDKETPLDPAVTADLFREWRTPRFGRANPERMNNPVWEWLIRSRLDAYSATQKISASSALAAGPGWCFNRFGQSSTKLTDGRTVLIAGEHEDHYDPDFNIYNDVVVRHPDGKVDIFGYPAEVFPPTDFHTATLVGNLIIIIGCLGYPAQRKPGTTPIFVLNLAAFAISSVQTCGMPPGWIHEHEAILEKGEASILVQRGKLDRGSEATSLVENIDDWRLHLGDWRWERISERRWQRWDIVRKDRKPNHLWEIKQALWSRSVGWKEELHEQMEQLTQALGVRPNLDLVDRLFRPPILHEQIPEVNEECNVVRINVVGVVVRYVEDMHSIQMTVEGELPQTTIETLTSDLYGKMAALENALFDMKQL
jgi:hypothetical protein